MNRKWSFVVASAVVAAMALSTPVAAQAGRLLTGAGIKDGSVTTADVANGSLKRKDFAPGALPVTGAQGPVVTAVFEAGSVSAPTVSLAFIAPIARAVVAEGQAVSVVSSATLGGVLGTNGARDLNLDVCYQQLGGAIEQFGSPVTGLTAGTSQVHLFTLAAVHDDLAPGTYDVGLCGSSSDAADWSAGGGGQTTAQVLKTK